MISTLLKLRFAVVFALVALVSASAFAKGPGVPWPTPPGGGIIAKGPGVPWPTPPGGGEVA
jgi:hypothetical protein